MNRQKTILQEIATSAKAIKEARLDPIPQPTVDRSMSFLRSFVLDLPMQTGGFVDTLQEQVIEDTNTVVEQQELDTMKRLAGLK
jgi:hypothetical protein